MEGSPVKVDIVLDTRGLFCPMPIIKTSEAIGNLTEGGIIEVISDDPAIEHDMPAWCRSNGHEIRTLTRQGGVYRYFVQKRGAPSDRRT
jgi:TusA-related sulfurtransferase